MMRWLWATAFACAAFAAGLVTPQGGIALGEVQPGEAFKGATRLLCCTNEVVVDFMPRSRPAGGL